MTKDPRHAILKRWIMEYASGRSGLSAYHFADEALKEMDALPQRHPEPPAPRATDDPSDPHLTLTLCIANALIHGTKSAAIATNVADGVREFEEKRGLKDV